MTKKEFICIIWGYHKQIYNFPKEQNYHLHPIEVARKMGYDIKIISINDIHPMEDDPNFPKDITILRFASIFQYLLFLYKKRDAAFYVNTLTFRTLIVGLFVKKSIFIPHDYIFGSSWLKERIIKFFYHFFTKVRVNNNAESCEINSLKNNLSEIIPLVIDTSNITRPRQHENFILLSLGNLIPKKNPELLLQALSETKRRGYQFQLITIGADRLRESGKNENYKELIEKYRLNDQVQYLGYIPIHEAQVHIQKAALYVNMSSYEGLCLAVYESICAGLGVVLPDILSFKGVFGENAYIYKSGDINALADILIRAYHEQKVIPRKVKHLQKIIKGGYNYEDITHKLYELFQKTYE